MRDVLQHWFDEIAKSDEGRLAVSNLLHDYHEHRVSPAVLGAFLERVADEWGNVLTGRSPAALIPIIARAAPTKFLCQGHAPFAIDGACSRVVPAKDLIRDNIRYEGLAWVDSPDYVPDELLEELERGWDEAEPYGTLPSAAGRFAWVTRRDALDALLTEDPTPDKRNRATQVRDALGLAHLVSPIQLVVIEYPPDVFSGASLYPPTFLDGSPYVVFRCANLEGWGRTFNLGGGRELPEAIHVPVEFDRSFRIRNLGYTRRLKWSFDYDGVWRNAKYPWTDVEVVALLNSLFP